MQIPALVLAISHLVFLLPQTPPAATLRLGPMIVIPYQLLPTYTPTPFSYAHDGHVKSSRYL